MNLARNLFAPLALATSLLLPAACGAQTPAPAEQPAASAPPAPAQPKGRVEYTEFESASLGGQKVRCAVSLPASYDGQKTKRYPLVVFLHGLNNSERDWEAEG